MWRLYREFKENKKPGKLLGVHIKAVTLLLTTFAWKETQPIGFNPEWEASEVHQQAILITHTIAPTQCMSLTA